MGTKAIRILIAVLVLISASFAVNVTVSTPGNGASVNSSTTITASATSGYPITGWRVYVDGTSVYQASSTASISAPVTIAAGAHQIIVRAWDSTGAYGSSYLQVSNGTSTGGTGVSVSMSSPAATTVASPVSFGASASSAYPITGWRIYVDGSSVYSGGATNSISAPVTLAAGTHQIIVRAWNTIGAYGSVNQTLSVGGTGTSGGAPPSGGSLILKNDLATGDLSQWTNKDWGLGTNTGSNNSGAGYLWYHSNVAGRRAAGMTVTPTAHASPAASSDSVYLWEPTQAWNYNGQEVWLRTSFLFPSSATIGASGATGEAPFEPTTGEWNWFMTFHNDSNPLPSCTKEYGNIAFDVRTDDAIIAGNVGTKNVRLSARILGGNDCSPNTVYVDGPVLQRDHWYEYLLHIKWSPTGGIFEWFVDGQQYYSNFNIPTLFTRPAGYVSPSYTSLTMANYRWHAGWNSTIYVGPLAVGTTKSAVQAAF